MNDIIKQLKEAKSKECDTCGCQRYEFCNGYNKALEHIETKVKNLALSCFEFLGSNQIIGS